jgi:aspartyl/asparaginyl-tRNA synthetase
MLNYRRLIKALDYYKNLGYIEVEVPWIVDAKSIALTNPEFNEVYQLDDKFLIASGEQGLLHTLPELLWKGTKYVTLTPCFRKERKHHPLLHQHFMKVELGMYIDEGTTRKEIVLCLDNMINDALNAMLTIHSNSALLDFKVVEVDYTQSDILLNGIEVGSYGYRKLKTGGWLYGTGLAEPRFTQALDPKKPA